MKLWAGLLVLAATTGALAAVGTETVPLYTNDDLDRMFGPPLPAVTNPVDKSTPQDWGWVEGFLDREYARIDADRRYDLERRATELVERREENYDGSYTMGGYYPWGYGGGYLGWRQGWHAGWQPSGGGWHGATGGWHGIPGMREPVRGAPPHPQPHGDGMRFMHGQPNQGSPHAGGGGGPRKSGG